MPKSPNTPKSPIIRMITDSQIMSTLLSMDNHEIENKFKNKPLPIAETTTDLRRKIMTKCVLDQIHRKDSNLFILQSQPQNYPPNY